MSRNYIGQVETRNIAISAELHHILKEEAVKRNLKLYELVEAILYGWTNSTRPDLPGM